MKFSLVPLLVAGQSISATIRQALLENRLKDAAAMTHMPALLALVSSTSGGEENSSSAR